MILTERQIQELSELPALVARALSKAPNPDVPFFLDDAVVSDYEMLRAVWVDGMSINAACEKARRSRTDYYRCENAFLGHGVAALFPQLGVKKQDPKLERLAILVRTTRPKATETMILRFAEGLAWDPCPSVRTIGRVLHSHGFGNVRDQADRDFWYGLQESMRAIQWACTQRGPARDKSRPFQVGAPETSFVAAFVPER